MPVERLFAIDPDAHATEEIDNLRWGVLMARKGAVPKDRVINTLGAKDFGSWLEGRRRRSSLVAAKRRRAAHDRDTGRSPRCRQRGGCRNCANCGNPWPTVS